MRGFCEGLRGALVARRLVIIGVVLVDVLWHGGRCRASGSYRLELGRGDKTPGREVGKVVFGGPAPRLRRRVVVHMREVVRSLLLAAGLHQVSKRLLERHV